MFKLSRRQVIQQMGLWPLMWPLVRAGRVEAQEATTPKRVVIIFTPNGPIMRDPAEGTETDFKINDWWGPLERHKPDAFVFRKMRQAGVPFGKHNEYGHQSGGTGALTARTTEGTNNSTGPSLDQFIGQELQKKGIVTPKRNLLWGLHRDVGHWGPWYEAAGKPTGVQNDPYKALADIAPSLGTGTFTAPVDPRLLRKHFVLDSIYKDCRDLTAGLGAEARTMLDFHCSNLESLEKSVGAAVEAARKPKALACSAPEKPNTSLPSNANFGSWESRDEMCKAFAHLTALAFSCDVTRVVGFSFEATSGRFGIPASYKIPASDQVDSGDSGAQHHAWTHVYNTGETKQAALRGFYRWYSEQVATFLDVLKATKDASGKPLMDSTLVLWTSELGAESWTDAHPNAGIPVFLFGTGGAAWKPNRLYNGDNSNETSLALHALFVSMIQHTGLSNINVFGNSGSGPLEWLKG